MNTIDVLLATGSIVTAGMSLLIARGKTYTPNKIFALFILSISLWTFGIFSFLNLSSPGLIYLFCRTNYVLAAMIAALFLHFSLIFPVKSQINKFWIISIYFPVIVILLSQLLFPQSIIVEIRILDNGLRLATVNNIGYLIYEIYFIAYLIIAYVKLFKSYRESIDRDIKTQIRFVIGGTLIPYLIAMYFDLILPVNNYEYVWAGPLMAFIVVYVLLYAVYKHHLLNSEVITAEILIASLWLFILIRILMIGPEKELGTDLGLLGVSFITGLFLIRSFRRELSSLHESKLLASELSTVNASLISLNTSLSDKVREQTREVRQAYELEKKARHDLEKLNESKDQFIMITQHHLRMPVTGILWETEAIMHGDYGEVPTGIGRAITEMRGAGKRLKQIVDDFLDITAIKAGASILTIAEQSLKPAIDDIIAELKGDIERMKITVECLGDESAWPRIDMDAGKMREALLIVIENAVRYNFPGGSITISPEIHDGRFRITVENTGIGINGEERGKIGTSLFYRGREARKNNPIGMGIGLSVAKAVIKAHRGALSIESKGEGRGAKVTVDLPIKRSAV